MPSAVLLAYSAELDFYYWLQKRLRAFLKPFFTGDDKQKKRSAPCGADLLMFKKER